MNAAGPPRPVSARPARTRALGAALLLALVLLVGLGQPWVDRMQAGWFDLHQTLWPRPAQTLPVTVVAIDQKSLLEMGQWPWPRHLLARLVREIQLAQPAAVGINILMPEADALSPERLLGYAVLQDSRLAAALRTMTTHDAQLAEAIAAAQAVLVVAGTAEPTRQTLRAAPVAVRDTAASAPPLAVPVYPGAVNSIEALDSRAGGWGLISADSSRGVIRRLPTVASIGGTLVPALAIEMLRVAQHAPVLRLQATAGRVGSLTVGRLQVPTEADGAVRVYFSPHLPQRFVSAVDVLESRVSRADLRGQLVLIGLTGVGLQEFQNTPIGQRMSGSEIQAQLIENLLDGTLLRRPACAPRLEAGVLLVLGGLLLWAVPRWRTHNAALLLLAGVALPLLLALAAFRSQQLMFDALTPSLALLLFFGVLLLLTLGDTSRQSRALQRQLQQQREDGARLSGELQAAQQVQIATLPHPEALQGDARLDLHATLQPAREVGGDLYDFFMLDERRLFLLIGDVAGKGLSASIFMAVSKALYKSAMLRAPQADLGAIMAVANAEVSRDNPGNLFVTCFAAVLDLDSGELRYCNAGHDNPWRLHASHPAPRRIDDGDGPPLCAVADYDYRGARTQLLPGELLCLMTDGVTEAQTAEGRLYGHDRLQQRLAALQGAGATARVTVESLRADVAAFAAGAEQADDLTILALRWHGPQQALQQASA